MVNKKILYINGDFTAFSKFGLSRYGHEIVRAMDDLIGGSSSQYADVIVKLVVPKPIDVQYKNIQVLFLKEIRFFKFSKIPQFWIQIQLPRVAKNTLLNFANFSPLFKRNQILCIHDAYSWFSNSGQSTWFRLRHRVFQKIIARYAKFIFTVSKNSQNWLTKLGVVDKRKIGVAYNGSEHARRWNGDQSLLKLPSARPYILGIGRSEINKNSKFFWTIAHQLDASGIDIVIVGHPSFRNSDPIMREEHQNIHILGFVSDDDLAKLMDNALCMVFPSEYEGFGLPVLEAMARGCPVICSDIEIFKEICNDAVISVRLDDPVGWVQSILHFASDPDYRKYFADEGISRSHHFSWKAAAMHYLDCALN